jgi:hypothetical protein
MSDTKGYIRGYVSRALLAGALGYPQTPEIRVPHVSRMYPACIPHVSIHISIAWTQGQTRREREQETPWLHSTTKHKHPRTH